MKDWKEEFKRDFYGHPGNTNEIISYIEALLDQQKQDLIKKLEGEKSRLKKYPLIYLENMNMKQVEEEVSKRELEALNRAIEIIRVER